MQSDAGLNHHVNLPLPGHYRVRPSRRKLNSYEVNLGRRFWLATALLVLLSFSPGCKKQSQNPSDSGQDPQSPTTAQNTAKKRHIVVRKLVASQQISVPPITEWETEQLNELASKQLKELGRQLTLEVPMQPDLLIAKESVSNSLYVSEAPREFHDGGLTVRRVEKQQDAPDRNLGSQFAELQQSHRWQKSKFKIIRVRKGGTNRFATEAYFHVSGRSNADDANVEVNSTWSIRWQLEDDGLPRITRINSQAFEHVMLHAQPLFSDVTASVLGGTDVYGHCISPSIGSLRDRIEHRLRVYNVGHHGIAIGDVNGDDVPDAYVCQTGGMPNHLFIQNVDGTVTETALVANVDYLDNTRAALLVDLDNDGDQDLVLTLTTGMLMLENNGHGRFRERARLHSVEQGFSLSAADFNHDGWLDIYVCVYYGDGSNVSELPGPVPYFDATNGGENHLIFNEGDWKFRDGTGEAQLDEDNSRFSFASVWDDFDDDGDQDLLVVNDYGPNQLFRNTDGRFANCAEQVGLVDGAFGMSASFGDSNRDGRSDIYVANMFSAAGNRITTQEQFKPGLDNAIRKKFLHLARGNSLFLAQGEGFVDASVSSGVTVGRWSWGSLFADINNDGWEDLLVGNGYVTGKSRDDL